MNTAFETTDLPALHSINIYPEDFIIACGIHRLRPEELLQHFIKHFHLASLWCGASDNIEHAVTETVLDYLKPGERDIELYKTDVPLRRKWLKKLEVLMKRDGHLPEMQLRKNLTYTLSASSSEILKHKEESATLSLPGGYTVDLNSSFIIMCFMFGVNATAVLQHLVDNISLAKDAAQNQFGEAPFNPFMNFFHNIAREGFRDSKELRNAGFYVYDHLLVELYDKMKEEQDYEIRLAAFTEHYYKWYNAIKEIPIRPAIR
jgi:hypothetical protein